MVDPTTKPLLQVARDVLSQLDVDEVLRRVLSSAQALTESRYAALGVLDDEGYRLARFLTEGMDEEEKRQVGPLPTGHGILGELIRNPEPLRVADVSAHLHAYGFPGGHPPMRSFLGVPIFVGGRAYGNLYLTEKEGAEEFTATDEEAVVLLAEFAGLAIDHARRYARSEASRHDLERKIAALDATVTIARTLAAETDLEVILDLVAKRGRALVSARALVIAAMEGAEPTAAQELIQRAITDVEAEAEKLRSLITDLRPVALDQLGVAAAIEALADSVEGPELEIQTRINLSFEEGRAEDRLDGELETAVYRIVQEALANARKHAQASSVVVEVVEDDGRSELRISVQDDGDGFDPSAVSDGFGLNGMRERVELLGGSIEIRSSDGEGTEVGVVMPSRRGAAAARAL